MAADRSDDADLPEALPSGLPDPPDDIADPLAYERALWTRDLSRVAGVDEAGRGPLAGPVVAAAVILPRDTHLEGAVDSKLIPADRRSELCARIEEEALAVSLGAASVREIDRFNVLEATTRAVERALRGLHPVPDHVVVDGLPLRNLERRHTAVVGADRRIHSVACASIVAKVYRDRLMRRLAPRYPVYLWESNMGYGTAEHRDAIREHGLSPHHRITFCGLQLDLGL